MIDLESRRDVMNAKKRKISYNIIRNVAFILAATSGIVTLIYTYLESNDFHVKVERYLQMTADSEAVAAQAANSLAQADQALQESKTVIAQAGQVASQEKQQVSLFETS